MEELGRKKFVKTPYDAQDNRNTTINVEGLSSYYHRVLSFGHDPIIGFIAGIFDIVTGRMTTLDKKENSFLRSWTAIRREKKRISLQHYQNTCYILNLT